MTERPIKESRVAVELGTEDRPVLIRFEYVTQAPYSGHGWAIDNIAVPELSYYAGAEGSDGGWEPQGFVRGEHTVDQGWQVRLIEGGRVTEMRLENGRGRADVRLDPNEPLTVVVSATAPRTKVPAEYRLAATGGATLVPAPAPASESGFVDDFGDECSGWEIESADIRPG